MPDKGQKQTEETKRKISEALKKGGAKKTAPRSASAQKLYNSYTLSKRRSKMYDNEIDVLRAKARTLGRKKGVKKQREAIAQEIKALQQKKKQEQEKRRQIVEQAKAEHRVKKAEIALQKIKSREQKIVTAETKARELIGKAKDADRRQRIQDQLDRIAGIKERQRELAAQAEEIIADKGKTKSTGVSRTFDFQELSERKFEPWRDLTEEESRVNFLFLTEELNTIESELERSLREETEAQIEYASQKAEQAIEQNDISAAEAIAIGYLLFNTDLNKAAKQSYEVGKTSVIQEMGIDKPPTDKQSVQARKAEMEQVAQAYGQSLENEAKSLARTSILVGATALVARNAIREKLKKSAEKMIAGMVGTIPSQYVNRGRSQVLYDNLPKITHFMRSEILDGRTCPVCISLDKRIVKADDPFARMDVVHTWCRGMWVPIKTTDGQPPQSAVGLPKSIRESFNSIDGRPIANDFTQMKKATNTKDNPDAQEEIKKRL